MNLGFKEYLEETDYNTAYYIAQMSGQSSGVHGRTIDDERPAGDPRNGVTIELEVNHKHEPFLVGHEVIVVDQGESGSYHERWWNGFVYVSLPDEVAEEMFAAGLNMNWFSQSQSTDLRGRRSTRKNIGKFTNLRDVIKKSAEVLGLEPPFIFDGKDGYFQIDFNQSYDRKPTPPSAYAPKPGESSEEYWKRQIDRTWFPKTQWDGD